MFINPTVHQPYCTCTSTPTFYHVYVTYTQCAAVMAHPSDTMVAPHLYPAELCNSNCHGHCPLLASWPPMIRGDPNDDLPQKAFPCRDSKC